MRHLRKIFIGALFISLLGFGTLLSNEKNNDINISLKSLIKQGNACVVELPGWPNYPCQTYYCPDTMMFTGCGSGNGNSCSALRYC